MTKTVRRAVRSVAVAALVAGAAVAVFNPSPSSAGDAEKKIVAECLVLTGGTQPAMAKCVAALLATKEIDVCVRKPHKCLRGPLETLKEVLPW